LIALEPALAELLASLGPVASERAAFDDAVGRVLATDLVSSVEVPRRATALRDGWSVRASETVGASPYAPALLTGAPALVRPGDQLPPDADAVVPAEALAMSAGVAELTDEAAPGEGARRAGEDVAAGFVLRRAGERVRALDAAIAAAAGVASCDVRRCRVAIVAHPSADAACGLVAAFARERGGLVSARLADASGGVDVSAIDADLVVIVGSVEGTRALADFSLVVANGLALRPGEDAGCGILPSGAPVVVVPARLEAAFAVSRCVLGQCLDRLLGTGPQAPAYAAPLTRKISSAVGVAEVALVRAAPGGLEPIGVADLTLSALARADAWLLVPAEREGYAAGEVVEAFAV
jgi:molybdopterin molybdotransferase